MASLTGIFLEQKPPLAVLLYALPQWLGLASVSSLASDGALLARAGHRPLLFAGPENQRSSLDRIFGCLALWLSLSAGARKQGISANTELFVALPMILALLTSPFPQDVELPPFPLRTE